MVRTRADFDEILVRHAERAGVRLIEGANVTGPILDERSGHVTGVRVRRDGEDESYTARLVVAADGNSTRLSIAMGLHKRTDRPMGVAVRTYFRSPRHDDDYLETWLELWDGDRLLPGYGGSSAWATAPPTSVSACSTPARRSRASTTATCSGAG